jgi:predicted nucleic acid-binding protein
MICIDASVAVKWLFPEERSDKALGLVEDAAIGGERIIAPHLLPVEVSNIVRRRMRQDGLVLDEAQILLAQFFAFPITLRSSPALHRLALAISDKHNLAAVYDSAIHRGCSAVRLDAVDR